MLNTRINRIILILLSLFIQGVSFATQQRLWKVLLLLITLCIGYYIITATDRREK